MAPGKVWLVGAGPGDPELITVRGAALIAEADVILYDALSHPDLLRYAKASTELRNVGKRGGTRSADQRWITEQLIELARQGKRVVRLKGGDSFLFARGAEEAEELARAGIEFEVVPGLSSPVGTSAFAGIPLTHRELSSSVTFITGSDKAGRAWSDVAWKKLATATDTLCVLMGMRRIEAIARAIIEGGRDPETPVAVIQWGARPEQKVLVSTLSNVAVDVRTEGLENPAVIIVGEVVRLRAALNWYERSPLFGQRVLVPRPPHQAVKTAAAIRARAAEPVVFPVIEIAEPPHLEPLQEAVRNLRSYDWVLFTSANGVTRFFEEVNRQGADARALGNASLGVIGPRTGDALQAFGVRADLVAKEYIGEGLARDMIAAAQASPHRHEPLRVLIPRALVARENLPNELRAQGMHVDVVPAYETRSLSPDQQERFARLFRERHVDIALFTSSSTIESTCAALGAKAPELLRHVTVASIGPITTQTAERLGIAVDVTAEEYTIDGLLDAVGRFKQRTPGTHDSATT